ncbi:NAD-specific glutamate dehydrogenase [Haloarcula amylolytica JCM 13557]|uniref:NAD-specific glutamate dehydrogenase n=1 Tax=Haloarcula amylolytica JCM 13557 TaxID=1227452 RepID=M0KEI6_9EURY|nr:NAD-specific glutamate dehydrogenase [Haloarcula amylolytica JCM 13557]
MLADLLQFLAQGFGDLLVVFLRGVLVFEDFLDVLDFRLDVGLEVFVDLLLVLVEERLGTADGRFGLVARFDALAALLVLFGVLFGLLLHLLDLVVGEASTAFDGDILLVARALVLGFDVDDPVLVDVKGHFNLGRARGGRRDAGERERAEQFVLLGNLTLALEDADLDLRLVVLSGREDLRLLGRNGRVLVDEPLEQTTLDLDTQRQRRHVEQDDVVHVAAQDAGLDGRAQRDGLVGVDVLLRLLPGHLLDLVLHLGHPRRATDENDLVDVAFGVFSVGKRLLRRADGALDEVLGEGLELRARDLLFEVQRPVVRGRDEREVDAGLLARGEFYLGFLGGFGQPLEGLPVVAEVDAVFGLELVGEVVDDGVVPVVATEVVVPVGRDDLVDASTQVEDGDVEGAAPEVVHEDRLVGLVVEAVGHRGRGRLVDDAFDLEAGDLPGVLGRLALSVVEVRRDGNDGLLDLVAEILLGVVFDLLEDHRRDLLRRVLLPVQFDRVVVLAHVALDRLDGLVGVLYCLVLRRFPDESLAVVERDDRGCRPLAFAVDNDFGVATFHDRERAVRGPKVDTQNLVARHLTRS